VPGLCLWVSKGVGHLGQHALDKRRQLVRLNVGGGDVDPVMVSKQVISGWPAGLPVMLVAWLAVDLSSQERTAACASRILSDHSVFSMLMHTNA
jgi:hypothetical protein